MNSTDKEWIIGTIYKAMEESPTSFSKNQETNLAALKSSSPSETRKQLYLLIFILAACLCVAGLYLSMKQVANSVRERISKKVQQSPEYIVQKLSLLQIQRLYKKTHIFKEFGMQQEMDRSAQQTIEAATAFIRRFANFPYLDYLYFLKAKTLLLTGKYEKGKHVLEETIRLFPNSYVGALAQYKLGILYEQRFSDRLSAIKKYQKALESISVSIRKQGDFIDQLITYYSQPRIQSSLELLVKELTGSLSMNENKKAIAHALIRCLKRIGKNTEAEQVRNKYLIEQPQALQVSIPFLPDRSEQNNDTANRRSRVDEDEDLTIIHFDDKQTK